MQKVMHNFLGMVKSLYIYQKSSLKKGPRRSGVKRGRGYIKRSKHIRTIGIATSSLLVLLTALAIFPITHHDDFAEATPGVEEVPTITITSAGGNTASVDITPTSANGTFAYSDASSQLAFTVSTGNYTGYTLSIKASDNAGQLTNTSYGATLDSITTVIDANTFETDTTGAYVNKWGYRPNVLNSAANTNFLPAPTTTETLLDNQTTATSENYTIDVGARVDYTKPIGTYTNTYSLIATANPVAYAINYYTVDGTYNSTTKKMGITQVGTTQASSTNTTATVTLAPTAIPTRSTYTFAGWCLSNTDHSQISVNDGITATYNAANTKITAYHDPGTVCDGTIYAAGDSLLIDPTIDNTDINFYAVWTPTTFDQAYAAAGKSKATVGSSSYYKMQDMSTAICNAVSPMQSTILFDYRKNVPANDGTSTTNQVDGTAYHIAKLPDGRCWMLDNLALNLNNQNVVDALTTSNTHVNSASLTAFKNGGGTDSNGRAQTAYAKANWTTGNQWIQPMINRTGKCDPDINVGYECLEPYQSASKYTYNTTIDKYGIPESGTTGTADTYNAYGLGNYKVGNYYNYCAASAGSYCYSSSDTTHTNNASYDICPANWKMPLGSQAVGSYYYLYQKISEVSATPTDSTNALSLQTMLSTPVSGYYQSGTARRQGNFGRFWSSTYKDAATMVRMAIKGTTFDGQASNNRYYGFSVRCIAQ